MQNTAADSTAWARAPANPRTASPVLDQRRPTTSTDRALDSPRTDSFLNPQQVFALGFLDPSEPVSTDGLESGALSGSTRFFFNPILRPDRRTSFVFVVF